MNREVHVRICGGPGVRFPRATRRSPVRTPIIRVPAGPRMSRRDRDDSQDARAGRTPSGSGFSTPI